jgi:tRNA pseudouridine38/39 synthase
MRTVALRALKRTMESRMPKLEDLSKEELIARIHALESQLQTSSHRRIREQTEPFYFHAHSTRKIALKFTYAGWDYNGLAAQAQPTPLPTVEQVLFDALVSTRLVDRAAGMDGCGWSRCGRTDRGVSAAGQVVSLRLRSALGEKPAPQITQADPLPEPLEDSAYADGEDLGLPLGLASPSSSRAPIPDPPKRELAYIHMLNRVLPPTIRIIAWSPVSDTFDARFSCQHRHYKYFFVRGGRTGGGGLDVEVMRDAARRLVGEHDFRNFCKLDPSKQIENFSRRVVGAWIEHVDRDESESAPAHDTPIEGSDEDVYVFNLKGTAFLWHQIRCIMAVLFLVGSRLENPSIVDHLLHTSPTSSKLASLPDAAPITSKPNYTMADALPLVLWDTGYRAEDITWQTDDDVECKDGTLTDRERMHNFWFQMYSIWMRDRIQTTMQSYFLRAAEVFYPGPAGGIDLPVSEPGTRVGGPLRLNMGGGVFRHTTMYTPVLELERGELAGVANERWREGAAGKRRLAKRDAKKGQ